MFVKVPVFNTRVPFVLLFLIYKLKKAVFFYFFAPEIQESRIWKPD